jgi:hypothetical protein
MSLGAEVVAGPRVPEVGQTYGLRTRSQALSMNGSAPDRRVGSWRPRVFDEQATNGSKLFPKDA